MNRNGSHNRPNETTGATRTSRRNKQGCTRDETGARMRRKTDDEMIEYLTAPAAVIAAAASLWNTYQFAKLSGRMDAAERAHSAHVNAPGLHGIR